jgi:hypothetical protein
MTPAPQVTMPSRSSLRRLLVVFVVSATVGACSRADRCGAGVTVDIEGDHAHSASIPADRVKRGRGGVYAVRGDGHQHAFALKDDDMRRLSLGEVVTTMTSSVNAHTHLVTLVCKP